MNKLQVVLISLCLLSVPVSGWAQAADGTATETEEGADDVIVHYAHYAEMPPVKELPAAEDDLYSGGEVRPLEARISEAEKKMSPEDDLDYIEDEYKMPELSCGSEKLRREAALFMRSSTEEESSVSGRRGRVLMVKNLHSFKEISEDEIGKDNFTVRAPLMQLRINENRQIYKICESTGNKFGRFGSVYLIIYPYVKYYKVVVANLVPVPEKTADATFTFSW